jgi:hypothetical protein
MLSKFIYFNSSLFIFNLFIFKAIRASSQLISKFAAQSVSDIARVKIEKGG